MAVLIHVLVVVLYLIGCSGVTHWRIKQSLIQPVNGNTIITEHLPAEKCDTARAGVTTSCEEEEEGESVSVYDRELAIIIKGLHIGKKAPWAPVSQVSSSVGGKCPPSGGPGSERPLTLKISDPKNPSNNRCHVARKATTDRTPIEPPNRKPRYTSTTTPSQDLACDSVEFTIYDFLKGIAQRNQLPPHPEPEVAIVFRSSDTATTIDMFEVEASLVKAVNEGGPLTCDLLGKIANYWRVKGDTFRAMECFRRALSLNPDDPEILLNLARLLFNHHYFEDVVFLTRKSLHVTENSDNTWKHYFLLAETYKKLKKYEEAIEFYKKTLEINPGLHTAEIQLRELGKTTMDTVTNTYTIVIISTLVTAVLAIMYHLLCPNTSSNSNNQ